MFTRLSLNEVKKAAAKANKLIDYGKNHLRGDFYDFRGDEPKYCLLGAWTAALGQNCADDAMELNDAMGTEEVAAFNDAKSTTVNDIVGILDQISEDGGLYDEKTKTIR